MPLAWTIALNNIGAYVVTVQLRTLLMDDVIPLAQTTIQLHASEANYHITRPLSRTRITEIITL